MPEYVPMLHVSYYAQNYAGIIRQGLWGIQVQTSVLCCGCSHHGNTFVILPFLSIHSLLLGSCASTTSRAANWSCRLNMLRSSCVGHSASRPVICCHNMRVLWTGWGQLRVCWSLWWCSLESVYLDSVYLDSVYLDSVYLDSDYLDSD